MILYGLAACEPIPIADPELTRNTNLELVDWHISGLWVINCPVAWLRVVNNNDVPIREIAVKYSTYNYYNEKLSEGTYTIEGSVAPHAVKNFIEQYMGLVDLHSDKLSVQLESVSAAE